MTPRDTAHCPLCGQENHCQRASSATYKGPCWCERVEFPADLLEQIPDADRNCRCVCAGCVSRANPAPASKPGIAQVHGLNVAPGAASEPPAEDFYLDDRGRLVFTEHYHRQRGYCCGNGCRHCPYGAAPQAKTASTMISEPCLTECRA